MMQPLRLLAALPKGLDSILSTHIEQLATTACNSSSYTCYTKICMPTHKNTTFFQKKEMRKSYLLH